MINKPLEIFIFSFIFGVLVASLGLRNYTLLLGIFLISVALFVFGLLSIKERSVRKKILLSVLIFSSISMGVLRYEWSIPKTQNFSPLLNNEIVTEGIVIREPDVREKSTLLTLKLQSGEKVLAVAEKYPEFSFGDRVSVAGKLLEPENFETEPGQVFDYRSYLAKDGIYFEFLFPKIELIEKDKANFLFSALYRLKSVFLSNLSRSISEPENGLLSGLILGEKHGLNSDVTDLFRKAGVIHIVVLSGYNLTIVAYAIMSFLKFFRFIPTGASLVAGGIGIILFTVLSGGSATAVRAAIMALLVLLAKITGRDYKIRRALMLAGFAMILHNPKILIFDPSFQLSFLATLGLIYLSPFFEKKLKRISSVFNMREIIASTLSTQIFVLPLLISMSGTISLISVVANILILPVIPITMFFGALTGFAGFIHVILAWPFSYISYLLLHYVISVGEFFGQLPFSSISIGKTPSFLVLLLYLSIAVAVLKLNKKVFDKKLAAEYSLKLADKL